MIVWRLVGGAHVVFCMVVLCFVFWPGVKKGGGVFVDVGLISAGCT